MPLILFSHCLEKTNKCKTKCSKKRSDCTNKQVFISCFDIAPECEKRKCYAYVYVDEIYLHFSIITIVILLDIEKLQSLNDGAPNIPITLLENPYGSFGIPINDVSNSPFPLMS